LTGKIAIVWAVAAVCALFLTPAVRHWAKRFGIIDQPGDPRRVHTRPTPRWGGMAIALAAGIGMCVGFWALGLAPSGAESHALLGLMLVGLAVLIMGALDDKFQFSAGVQLVFLLACGVVVQFFGVQVSGVTKPWPIAPGDSSWLPLGALAWPITAIWIFVVTKTMDTIDGLDGLAAGISAISACTLTVMSLMSHPQMLPLAVVSAAACGASLGFLKHNYNPAKIFMGTGGAQFLGFLLAGLSVIGAFKIAAVFSVGVPILIFGLPLLDAVIVVIRRISSRQPIYKADKRHLHHHLIAKGLSQRQTVLVLYAVAIVLCATAIWIVGKSHDDRHSAGPIATFGHDGFWDTAGRHQDGAGDQRAGPLPREGST
jgi:UDP-GlcNAc:undecaprenyl-phosphate/decaprenyl-phosphate GlcNAc-1-phosphate transferase